MKMGWMDELRRKMEIEEIEFIKDVNGKDMCLIHKLGKAKDKNDAARKAREIKERKYRDRPVRLEDLEEIDSAGDDLNKFMYVMRKKAIKDRENDLKVLDQYMIDLEGYPEECAVVQEEYSRTQEEIKTKKERLKEMFDTRGKNANDWNKCYEKI
jgi:hypothetical protein